MLKSFNRAGWPMAAALAIAATGATTPAAAPAQSAASRVLEVDTNQGRLVTLARPISDVFVANDAIADIQVRSPTQIYVFGKAPGETTVSATTKTGQVVFSATVRVGNNFGSINQMLDPLQDGRERMRKLGAEVVYAEERERAQVARELHDSVAQTLAARAVARGCPTMRSRRATRTSSTRRCTYGSR